MHCFPTLIWVFSPAVPFCLPLSLFPFSHPLQPLFPAPHSQLISPFYTQSSALLGAVWWFSFQQFSRNIWNLTLSCKTLPSATPAQLFAGSLLDPDEAEQDVLISSTLTLKGFCPHHTHPCCCSEHQAHSQSIFPGFESPKLCLCSRIAGALLAALSRCQIFSPLLIKAMFSAQPFCPHSTDSVLLPLSLFPKKSCLCCAQHRVFLYHGNQLSEILDKYEFYSVWAQSFLE